MALLERTGHADRTPQAPEATLSRRAMAKTQITLERALAVVGVGPIAKEQQTAKQRLTRRAIATGAVLLGPAIGTFLGLDAINNVTPPAVPSHTEIFGTR